MPKIKTDSTSRSSWIPFRLSVTGVLWGGALLLSMSYQWFNAAHQMEGRDREKDVSAWMFGGELSIYNSQSCLTDLGVNVMDALWVWWKFCVLKPWISLYFEHEKWRQMYVSICHDHLIPHTVLLKNCRRTLPTHKETWWDDDAGCVTLTLSHNDNWQLAPPFN